MIKAYTASSLKQALEHIQDAERVFVDKSDIAQLKCPITKEYPFNSTEPCFGNPRGCQKARFQNCIRSVKIHVNDNAGFWHRLYVQFTISATNHDGYIEKHDQILRWLIEDKKLIDRNDLVPVEV